MKCPGCQVDLSRRAFKGIALDHCEHCDGLWFDKGELIRAKNETDGKLKGFDYPLWAESSKMSADQGERPCPKGHGDMVVINYAGYADIPVDVCPTCQGVWLDKGEFEKIVSHLEDLREESSLASYLQDIEEEAKQLFASKKGFFAEAKDLLIVSKLLLYRIVESIPPVAG
jgi:Zn-finger nucleic acid-binding protein